MYKLFVDLQILWTSPGQSEATRYIASEVFTKFSLVNRRSRFLFHRLSSGFESESETYMQFEI